MAATVGASERAIFSGIRFVLLGFDSVSEPQYRAELLRGGGVDAGRLDTSCTHLIVSGRVYDDPVCVEARKDGKTVVTELWIEDSVDIGRLADTGRIMYRPVRDLNGIPGSDALYICLTGYQRKEREDIMKMVDLMGAHFSKPLIANKITHLICYKFEGEKYELAKRVNMKLVNHRWLEDCLKGWEILPTDKYLKSDWELEVLESEAKDSEEEIEYENARTPVGKITAGEPMAQTDMPKLGSSESSIQLREVPEISKDTEFTKQSPCDAEVFKCDRSSSTPCRSHHNNSNIYVNDELTEMSNYHDAGDDKHMGEIHIMKRLNKMDGINLNKENNILFDGGNAQVTHIKERKSLSSNYSWKSAEKVSPQQPQHLSTLKGKLLENDNRVGANISPLMSKGTSPGSVSLQSAPMDTKLLQEDNSSYLLPQKRKASPPEKAFSAPRSFQNSKSHVPSSFSIMSIESEAIIPSDADEVVNDAYIANGGIPLRGLASGKSLLNHEKNQSSSKPPSFSKGSLNPRQLLLQGRNSNTKHDATVLPKVLNYELGPSSDEKPRQEMALMSNSDANMTIMEPRTSHKSISPVRDLVAVPSIDVGLAKTGGMETCVKSTARCMESSIINGSNTTSPFSSMKHNQSVSFSPQKSNLAFLSDKFNVSTNDSSKLPIEVAKQQKLDENAITPDNLKSDVTKPLNGSCQKDAKGNIAEIPEVPPKKVIPRKIICSKPRVNKHRSCNSESAAYSDKSISERKAFARSEKEKSDKKTVNKKNHAVYLVSSDQMEDNPEVATYCPNKFFSQKAIDLAYASKDAEKENQPVEIKEMSNSVANENREKVEHTGELMHREKKVSESTGNKSVLEIHTRVTTTEPMWFILSGHRLQRKEFKQVIRRLRGRVCRDSHNWSYQATHFIVPEPVRRTEKFFAAAAAGRWILKTDYLSVSNEAGKFVAEEPFEWYKSGLSEDGAVDLQAPRKWRQLKEQTGHGAFYGLRIVIYGECIAPSLDTLKRVVKAGDGTILATSPPYNRSLTSGIDLAIISEGTLLVDSWIQEFLRHEIPCVTSDYLVEFVCKPGHPLDKQVLFKTNAWVERTFADHLSRLEEIDPDAAKQCDDDEELTCAVCGSRDREDVMLICGNEEGTLGCGIGTHIDCCETPLAAVPEEDWFCRKCNESKTNSKRKGKSSKKR